MATPPYSPVNWVDDITAASAENLNKAETGLSNITKGIQELELKLPCPVYNLPAATSTKLGGAKAHVVDNGDGTFDLILGV